LSAAVYYHGGNFVVGHKDLIQPAYVNKLLELGFGAVVSPDYRLSPTISAFEGPVTDARDAYAWSQAELPAKLAQDVGVKLDADRIATWGHSAGGTLAMLVASAPKPPRAILNLFGMLYFQDESYHSPLKMPPVKIPDAEFRDQVYKDVPPPTSAPPPFGPKGPDMSTARGAWLFSHMADGTFLKNVQPDGDYNKIDPASLFVSSFPPTFFGHGSADMAVNVKLTEKAHQALQELGVDSKLEIVEGAGHGFDMGKKPGDKAYDTVIEGLQFLRDHV
ncbi:Alpha/Beta hydrolase protein, partial [Ilyonectria robusta]|uniref:Alpha/Beta hydrolase protein n=1 Tax=Ilyonectria robusta TaxID=1079257 RepID=UPI001E8D88FA